MGVSLAAALLAALAMGAGAVAQAVAARRATGVRVLVHPAYLVGTGLDLGGWALSVLAMRHLPLLAVQTVLAGSLAVTVVLGVPVLGVRPLRRVWTAVLVVCLAGAVVVVAAQPGPPSPAPPGFTPALVGALLVVGAVAVSRYRHSTTVGFAVLAGVGYSGAAVAARAVHGAPVQVLAGEPLVWLVGGFALFGAVMFARALETRDDAVNLASAWLWVVEIVVPSSVGVLVLGDRVRPGWSVPALLAVAATVAATTRISGGVTR
ncbi:MAG: hypothetical protein ACYC1Z_00220 [Georgenia sp.]